MGPSSSLISFGAIFLIVHKNRHMSSDVYIFALIILAFCLKNVGMMLAYGY